MIRLRRRFLLGAALAAPAVARAQSPVTLRLHHFLPAVANAHAKLLAPWAKQVEADSQGRLRIDIYPAMQLGGTPPQLYDQARDGIADIIWTLPGSTPGRFPTTETIELPFVAARGAMANARAAQDFADAHLKDEVKDVKLLAFWAHDHGLIHANRAVRTMADLHGLKLRNPTRLAGEALKALGAVSVGMPVPQVPESLAQRVIDGCVVPWEVVPAIKVHELVKFHTDIPGSPTLYTATFFLAMNPAKYASLAPELRAAIDRNSGMAFADRAGAMWDNEAKSVEEMVRKRGNTLITIGEEEKARWIAATRPVQEAWVAQVKGRGLDGGALVADFKARLARHGGA